MLIFSIPFPFQFLACTTCLKKVSTVLCVRQSLMEFIGIIVLVSDAIPDCSLQRIKPRLQRKRPGS